MRQWKLSPIDLASLDKWDDYTEAKEAMFRYTDTADAPWTVGEEQRQEAGPDQRHARLPRRFDYNGKDVDVVGEPDPLIVQRGRDAVGD